jgi:hypothetical protein
MDNGMTRCACGHDYYTNCEFCALRAQVEALEEENKRLLEALRFNPEAVTAAECIDLLKWMFECQSKGIKFNEWLRTHIAVPAEERLAYLLKGSAK